MGPSSQPNLIPPSGSLFLNEDENGDAAQFQIPRPTGEVGRGGYNLEEKLGWAPDEYDKLKVCEPHWSQRIVTETGTESRSRARWAAPDESQSLASQQPVGPHPEPESLPSHLHFARYHHLFFSSPFPHPKDNNYFSLGVDYVLVLSVENFWHSTYIPCHRKRNPKDVSFLIPDIRALPRRPMYAGTLSIFMLHHVSLSSLCVICLLAFWIFGLLCAHNCRPPATQPSASFPFCTPFPFPLFPNTTNRPLLSPPFLAIEAVFLATQTASSPTYSGAIHFSFLTAHSTCPKIAV
jgi:hypothetical protein